MDVERIEDEKINLFRTELMIEEAALQLLDIRFSATGRKAKLEKIRRLKAAIAVHKRCPVELWEHIFELCCDPDAPLDTETRETTKHPVFTLLRVCSLWRTVVLNFPSLWRNIRAHNDERGIALTARWFSRAGSYPRSLSLVSSGGSLVAFQQIIAQYPFQSLSIKSVSVDIIDFSQIPVGSLLPLEQLSLKFNNKNADRTMLTSLFLHNHTLPNLRRLQVGRGVEMPQFHCLDPFMTWNHLHELYLSCPLFVGECLTILRHSRSIEKCSMSIAGTPFSLPHQVNWVANRLILPNLISLVLIFDHGSDVGNFINLLTLPKLKSLTLGGECQVSFGRPCSCTQSTLEELITRSRIRRLEEMTIHVPIWGLHIGRILQLLPFLRKLLVRWRPVLDRETAQNIGQGKLGSQLRELRIREVIDDCEIDRLLDALESREKTCWETDDVSRIRHASFTAFDTNREETRRRVDKLQRLGIDITVAWTRVRCLGFWEG